MRFLTNQPSPCWARSGCVPLLLLPRFPRWIQWRRRLRPFLAWCRTRLLLFIGKNPVQEGGQLCRPTINPKTKCVSGGFNAFWAPKSHTPLPFACLLLGSSAGPAPAPPWGCSHSRWSCFPLLPAGLKRETTLHVLTGCAGRNLAPWAPPQGVLLLTCQGLCSPGLAGPFTELPLQVFFAKSPHLRDRIRPVLKVESDAPDGTPRWACLG